MITNNALDEINKHWAVLAIGNNKEREEILKFATAKLVDKNVGRQLSINFEDSHITEDKIKGLAIAYEMAAIEGMYDFINCSENDKLQDQFIIGANKAFELYKVTTIKSSDELDFIYHFLHLSALAYCGDNWTALYPFYQDWETDINKITNFQYESWDKRILINLFSCWKSLFIKNSWQDLNNIASIIQKLRDEQNQYECNVLDTESNNQTKVIALRLMALYHWAKATELLSLYMLQGKPENIKIQLDKHFGLAIQISGTAGDAQLEVLLRWLHASSAQMVNSSVWWIASTINSKATAFIKNITEQSKPLLELLPPQKAAVKKMGLLDPAKTAVVIDIPTSGGKTLLAQFRMLQAINNFTDTKAWIAYVAPTKTLVSQITRRLRKDFSPIGIQVERLNGALEIDALEEDLLYQEDAFHILVATPEKMQLIIRNHKIKRPLSLLVMDEAHNIEDKKRGLRIELLLATVKQHFQAKANFLLLMPYVKNIQKISRWLAQDRNSGQSISLSTSPWKPNDRIIGFIQQKKGKNRGDWSLTFQSLLTDPKTIHLKGTHKIGKDMPLARPQSKSGLLYQTAAAAKIFSERGTSIAIARTKPAVWSMARELVKNMPNFLQISKNIRLVQNYLKTEISPNFELIEMLNKGIAIHHAGLSEEIRALIEWLVEENELKILCATTTIAQGINFPVSSIFMQSYHIPERKNSREMTFREFWNLTGRAGRLNQDSIGVVGIAINSDKNLKKLVQYVQQKAGDLVSQLVSIIEDLDRRNQLDNLEKIIYSEQWEDFRCYIAHLLNEKKELNKTLEDMEQMLSNTFGYNELNSRTDPRYKDILLDATKTYIKKIAKNMGHVAQADLTGFSVESVSKALQGINQLEYKLTTSDWMPNNLFGKDNDNLSHLFSIMFQIEQLNFKPDDIKGEKNLRMADIARAWISGQSIQDIAKTFFGTTESNDITKVYETIRKLANGGTWGLSALSQMVINFDNLSETEQRHINLIPAMLYYGVKTEESLLMCINSVPRCIAEDLGDDFKNKFADKNIKTARKYLKELKAQDWYNLCRDKNYLSGDDCQKIWQILSEGDYQKPKEA